jgi:hypothetical protein
MEPQNDPALGFTVNGPTREAGRASDLELESQGAVTNRNKRGERCLVEARFRSNGIADHARSLAQRGARLDAEQDLQFVIEQL